MIQEFRSNWKHYVLQSLFATLTLSIVLVFLRLQNTVIVASLGATAFIIFAMPKSITARPRHVIGGHLVGLVSGSICSFIPSIHDYSAILVLSLSVGISIFVMVVIDTEHPPASGTALGIAYHGFSWKVVMAVIVSVVLLSLVHYCCRKVIRDLV
jgi:CBS-domain-containing membrane protein